MHRQCSIIFTINQVLIFLSPFLLLIVRYDHCLSTKVLSILHLGRERTAASLEQKEETFSFSKVSHLLDGEILVPIKRFATLAVILEGSDNLPHTGLALLLEIKTEIAHFRLYLTIVDILLLKSTWIDHIEASEGIAN